MKSREQDQKFDDLMREFREACVHTAHREQAAADHLRQERAVAAMRADVRLRWAAPAFAALVLMFVGGGWGAWWYVHPEHGHPAGHDGAHVTSPDSIPGNASAVSDEVLLSEVQSDLSDRVPQALEPLAVSYTSNSHAPSGEKEIQ